SDNTRWRSTSPQALEVGNGMRIGLVIERFDPQRGGAEHWTYQHALALVRRGHEVHVVCESVGPAVGDAVTVHAFGRHRSRLARAAAAEQALRALQLDVVHDIGVGWYSDVLQSEDGSRYAQWEQKLLTLPAALRPWKRALIRVLPRYQEFRTLMDRQFRDPHRVVVAVSQMCADHYQQYHEVPAARIRVVYHGTDTTRFSPKHRRTFREPIRHLLGIAEDEVMFLFVGHDFVRKGLATAVRAVRRLAVEGCPTRLVVVGESQARWQKNGGDNLRRVVQFVGRVADAVPFYAAADALVLPTFYDPCSLTVGEAWACGLPVVTSRANGASEMLSDGRDGMILDDPADDVALCAQLRRLVDSRTREQMGAAARQTALRYPLERNCDEIEDVYEAVIRQRSARRTSAIPRPRTARRPVFSLLGKF
ncbi:MAG: glycosyltransferase family 4 protein, partial [Planctomycetota bacterium]